MHVFIHTRRDHSKECDQCAVRTYNAATAQITLVVRMTLGVVTVILEKGYDDASIDAHTCANAAQYGTKNEVLSDA
jgi:hypothetical protein